MEGKIPRYVPLGAWEPLKDNFIKFTRREWSRFNRFNIWGVSYVDLEDVVEILTKDLKRPSRVRVRLAIKGREKLLETEMRRSETNKLLKLWVSSHRTVK